MIFNRKKTAEEAPKPAPEATGEVDLSVKPGAPVVASTLPRFSFRSRA